MTEVLPVDAQLDLEFAYTPWRESCRDPLPTMQQCRRRAGHDGDHAAGYGTQRRRWVNLDACQWPTCASLCGHRGQCGGCGPE